jgi:hypothetical protein
LKENLCPLQKIKQDAKNANTQASKHSQETRPTTFTTIHPREEWLLNNKTVLRELQRGLKDAAEGRISSKST